MTDNTRVRQQIGGKWGRDGGGGATPTNSTRRKMARWRETKHRLHMARSTPHLDAFSYLVQNPTRSTSPLSPTNLIGQPMQNAHYLERESPPESMLPESYQGLQTSLHSQPLDSLASLPIPSLCRPRSIHMSPFRRDSRVPRLPTPCRL